MVGERDHRPEPAVAIELALAMLPAAALEQSLSRCTEAGAAGFVLVRAERSQARAEKTERWRSICREAAMLAGRLRVPEVRGPVAFEAAWRTAVEPWLLDREALPPLRSLKASGEVTLFVGPEGGWTPGERRLAGDRRLSLGPRNLRAETAALVGLATGLAALDA